MDMRDLGTGSRYGSRSFFDIKPNVIHVRKIWQCFPLYWSLLFLMVGTCSLPIYLFCGDNCDDCDYKCILIIIMIIIVFVLYQLFIS